MRILFVSLEFCDPIFSGNGTYSRTLVDGLRQHCSNAGLELHVNVVSAVPVADAEYGDSSLQVSSLYAPNVTTFGVPVPASMWRRLDLLGPWREFGQQAKKLIAGASCRDVLASDVVLVVDWHGAHCWFELAQSMAANVVYLNYRAFSNPEMVPVKADLAMYQSLELQCLQRCRLTVCLSQLDRSILLGLDQRFTSSSSQSVSPTVEILLPPVRDSVLQNATRCRELELKGELSLDNKLGLPQGASTKFVVCCVRLAPDKNAALFADVIAKLVQSGAITRDIVPLLFGSVADVEYATSVKERFRASCEWGIVLEAFLSPIDMSAIFTRSLLNFHPSLYDAYGLTIVEAAVCGCPSMIHKPADADASPVGASELLGLSGAVYCDFLSDSASGVAASVAALLNTKEGRETLSRVSQAAMSLGSAYRAVECGAKLLSYLS